MQRTVWLAAWLIGLAVGVTAVLVAHGDPVSAFADNGAKVVVELVAGYSLLACGLISWRRRPSSRFGILLAVSGYAWFLIEWNNPGVGSPLLFTMGLVLYAAAAPLVAHAVLVYAGAPLRRAGRAVVAAAYGGSVLLLGLFATFVFDPAAEGCSQCPRNLLLVSGSTSVYNDLSRAGVYVGVAWTSAAVLLLGWRTLRSSVALRRAVVPVVCAGCVYLGLVAADFVASVSRGYLANDLVDRRLWLAQAAALVSVTLAVLWSWLRERRTRAGLARLVVELANAPALGALERALGRSLGDPDLRLGYPLADGRYVNAAGQPIEPAGASTALIRDGVEVARLAHRPGLLDDPATVDALAATASLALENERLQAELLAQLADLRASRARIVATGDSERHRLERDLHDGAQQRLVAVAITLRIVRTRLEAQAEPDRAVISQVEQAEDELRNALAELRTLASGIFPVLLADEGLSAAVEELVEDTAGRLRITGLPERRFDPAVEMTAYRLIARTLDAAGAGTVSLTASEQEGRLVLELVSRHLPPEVEELDDRFGALDGTLEFFRPLGGRARLRGEIPCA